MEITPHLKTGATATAFLLIGTFAAAQTAPTARTRTLKPRDASSGQASGIVQRKDGAIVHSDYPRRVDERKKGNMGGIDGGSDAAAHADARSKAPSNASNSAPNKARTGENPLYEQSGNSGTNPLYESKDRLKANAGASNSQSGAGTAAVASKKHVAGVKYQNRTAAGRHSKKSSSTETFKQDFGPVQAEKR
ncbi:MAG: hypothetical protein ACRD25_01595 [Terracidiphilus sp.]